MRGALGAPTWSSDSKLLALGDELGMVYLWNATTGQSLGRLTGARSKVTGYTSSFVDSGFGRIPPLAFSPDHRHLVAGRDDGSLYVYSLQTLLPVAQMGQAAGALRWLQFAPDGLTLYGVAVNGKRRGWRGRCPIRCPEALQVLAARFYIFSLQRCRKAMQQLK